LDFRTRSELLEILRVFAILNSQEYIFFFNVSIKTYVVIISLGPSITQTCCCINSAQEGHTDLVKPSVIPVPDQPRRTHQNLGFSRVSRVRVSVRIGVSFSFSGAKL